MPTAADPHGAEWLALAVGVGRARLVAQREELTGIRTRAVTFGALTVTASAFVVSTGLGGTAAVGVLAPDRAEEDVAWLRHVVDQRG